MAVDDDHRASSKKIVAVVHSVSTIQPSHHHRTTSPPTIHYLSNLDLAFSWAINYLQLALYFRSSLSPGDVPPFISSLKESLSKALDLFPPLAARLTRDEHSGRLQLLLNGAGIPFYEAFIDAPMQGEGEDDLFYSPLEVELNPKDYEVGDVTTAPICRVQVTVFACGGVAIGFSSFHMVKDGLSAMEFLRAWGEIHRGLDVSTPPDFSTHLLKPRDPLTVSMPMPEIITSLFEASRAATISAPGPELLPRLEAFDPAKLFSGGPGRAILLDIPASMVDKLVEEVEQGAHSYGHASSFEAISALMWKSITRARDPPQDETSHYTLPVSIRGPGRWEPPLPAGFFGNAAVNSMATARVGDILSNDISFTAAVFHKTVKQVTPEFVRSAIDWIELQLQEGLTIGRLPKLPACTVMSTSFANFPSYSIDFGVGRIVHLGQTITPFMAQLGVVHVLPSRAKGEKRSRQVAVALPERDMKRLLEDESFTRYFPSLRKTGLAFN